MEEVYYVSDGMRLKDAGKVFGPSKMGMRRSQYRQKSLRTQLAIQLRIVKDVFKIIKSYKIVKS